ncbi:MAG: hypothetical protein ACYDH4_09530 [Candidatus Cryosericum sp.]
MSDEKATMTNSYAASRGPKPEGTSIRLAGAFFDYFVVDTEHFGSCGDLERGVSFRFESRRKDEFGVEESSASIVRRLLAHERASFVLDWEDLKAAYYKVLEARRAQGLET